MRQLYHDWIDWWFDRPWLYVGLILVGLLVLHVSNRRSK